MACFIISPHSHLFLNSPHQPFGHTNLATALPISDSPFMAWQPLNLSSPTNPLLKPSTWRPYVPDSSLFFNGKNKLGQNNKIIPMTHLHIVLNWRETPTIKRIGGKHSPTRILLLHNPPSHRKPKKKRIKRGNDDVFLSAILLISIGVRLLCDQTCSLHENLLCWNWPSFNFNEVKGLFGKFLKYGFF